MAKNRKNQAAAIRFGPALKALFLCLVIAGSAVGYVWQKSQVYQLGKQRSEMESRLAKLARDNRMLVAQLDELSSPVALAQGAPGLGLVPQQPGQVVRLPEKPLTFPESQIAMRPPAARPAGALPH